jgi:hypothetical protein
MLPRLCLCEARRTASQPIAPAGRKRLRVAAQLCLCALRARWCPYSPRWERWSTIGSIWRRSLFNRRATLFKPWDVADSPRHRPTTSMLATFGAGHVAGPLNRCILLFRWPYSTTLAHFFPRVKVSVCLPSLSGGRWVIFQRIGAHGSSACFANRVSETQTGQKLREPLATINGPNGHLVTAKQALMLRFAIRSCRSNPRHHQPSKTSTVRN